jgi:hypothetical protein
MLHIARATSLAPKQPKLLLLDFLLRFAMVLFF